MIFFQLKNRTNYVLLDIRFWDCYYWADAEVSINHIGEVHVADPIDVPSLS